MAFTPVPMMPLGYGQLGSFQMQQVNPYSQFSGAGGLAGAQHDVGMAGAMASVLNNQTNAQAGYDTAYGQAKYGRANLLDQLQQQYMMGQMTNDTNRFGIQTQADTSRYGADRQYEGAMGVAGINADTSRYNTDANREVAMANQQNQIALANLSNSGNRDIAGINANASMYPHQLKQERFSQVLPLFQSLLGGPQTASAPSPVTPPPAMPQMLASAPMSAPPPSAAPSPQAPAVQASYGMPAQPPQRVHEPDPYQSSHGLYSYSVMGKNGMAQIPRAPGRAAASAMRPARGLQTQTARTATPQSPARPPWLIGDIPRIG